MNKNTYSLLFTFVLLLCSSFVAFAAPSSAPTGGNIANPITLFAVDQVKNEGVSPYSMIVGDSGASATGASRYVKFTTSGWLGVMLAPSVTPAQALDVNGSIRLSSLNIPGVQVCADTTGMLVSCGVSEYKYPGGTFTVPSGVSSITVEVWGAGGAGYGVGNGSGQNGGDTKFIHATNSSLASITAKGGGASTAKNTGGSGASSGTVSGSRVTSIANQAGTSGGNGSSGGSRTTSTACSSGTIIVGGAGGIGGVGGHAGNSSNPGANTPGGDGGHRGTTLKEVNCDSNVLVTSDFKGGIGFLGDVGLLGTFGSGGSGAGGRGGDSSNDFDNNVSTSCGASGGSACTASQQGYAGGGGGGYIKATISVMAGESYTVTVPHGGTPAAATESGTCWLNYHYSGTCISGATSGVGGDGFVRVTF